LTQPGLFRSVKAAPSAALRSWVLRARSAHPDHRAIARGMAWVALFVFASKLAGAAKEMAVAWRYGAGQEVDAYLFVFNLVSWPLALWLSLLTVVLVPFAARIRAEGQAELIRFRSELLGFSILLGVLLAGIAVLALPPILRSSWAGLPPGTRDIALAIAPTLSALIPLGIVASLYSAWMLATGRHANTLFEGIPALVLMVAILTWAGSGVAPLVWGTILGFALQLVALAVMLGMDRELSVPRFTFHSSDWSAFWKGFTIMMLGQALMSVTTLIDQFFAGHLGTGAIASLSYANRILVLILSLGATAVTRATLPVFSRTRAGGSSAQQLRRLGMQWTRILWALGAVGAVVGWLLAPWAVRILFERGAFTSHDSTTVTRILRYGLGQLPFYFAGLVLVSMLTSQLRYVTISLIATVNLLVKLVGNALLVPRFGVPGLMVSTTVMLAVSSLLLVAVVYMDERKGRATGFA
jgi:peptidoglycan biosynthesis protein MviN/MurJ (putative lipid II flippase)